MALEFEPYELDDGTVLQSGLSSQDEEALPPPYRHTYGYIARGVVTRTYYTDDDGWSEMLWSGPKGVFVDVRLFGKRSRNLSRIPVCQGTGGLWDEQTYIPRGASKNIAGGQLVTDSSYTGSKPTEAHNMDGDHVLVGFLECDPLQPIVFPFSLPHPVTGKEYKETDGRVRRIRHNGVLIEWDKEGNLAIDASGAAKADLDNTGKEVSNSGTAGKIKLFTNDGTDESSLELDNLGGITITSGAGDTVKLVKSSKLIELKAGAKITADATATLELKGPVTTIDATTSITATSASITLGPTGAMPVVKHTPWQASWAAMIVVLATQLAIYGGGSPPAQVAVSDYKNLLTALNTVSSAYAALATAITKAG